MKVMGSVLGRGREGGRKGEREGGREVKRERVREREKEREREERECRSMPFRGEGQLERESTIQHPHIYPSIVMFADDIILLSTCIEGIRKHMKTMEHFFHEWNLAINTEKNKVCTFGTCRHHCVLCQNTPLENVNSYKELGVWISKNGKFTKSKTALCLQAKKVVFGLKRAIERLKSPPVQVSLHLYNTIVRPFLCYGCEVWGFHSDPNIERVEIDFIKYILHLPAKATNSAA